MILQQNLCMVDARELTSEQICVDVSNAVKKFCFRLNVAIVVKYYVLNIDFPKVINA